MTMYCGLRKFIRVSLFIVAVLAVFTLAYAGNTSPADDTFSAKDIIMVLFGLLQTVFMGIGVWLIANDRELFTRMGKVESAQAVQTTKCEERWNAGNHPHRRENDH